MTMKCGSLQCDQRYETIEQLRTHWAEAHIEELRPINDKLIEVDIKVDSLEELANEGMVGHKDMPWSPLRRQPFGSNQPIEELIATSTAMKWLVNKKRREVRI